MPRYTGERLCIEYGEDADKTFQEALSKIPPNKRERAKAQIRALMELLCERGRLRSPDQFRNEEDGFYAIKGKDGLRAYGWFANKKAGVTVRGIFAISHFILKKKDKLDPKDKAKMIESRRRYENHGIE